MLTAKSSKMERVALLRRGNEELF